MAASGWVTVGDVEIYWPHAHDEVEVTALTSLLAAAQEQCEAFAPTLPEGTAIPEGWRVAHAMQARALWRSSVAGSGNQIGADGMTITVFPMDWTVKALLRPKRGVPVLG